MMKRIIMFDWDGTLVNSLDWKVRNGGELFTATFNVRAEDVEVAYRRHSGIPRRKLFDAIALDLGLSTLSDEKFAAMSARFTEMNKRVLMDPLTPGLLPAETPLALKKLAEAGRVLYISSSADTVEITAIAEALGIAHFFPESGGEIMGSTRLHKGKEHVAYVCQQQSVALTDIIFVGDEPADVALGKEAGVFTVAKVGTYTEAQLAVCGPHRIIHSLLEL